MTPVDGCGYLPGKMPTGKKSEPETGRGGLDR